MTGQAALDAMREIRARGTYDVERNHVDADNVLCELLRTLGFNALVDEYAEIEMWYA